MLIKNLKLKNFRNIKDCSIDFSSEEIIFTGNNGQGKTNILEAIYILCYGSSFRAQKLSECIQHENNSFYLSTEYSEDNVINDYNLSTEINIYYENIGKKNNKLIKINGKEIKDRKDLIYRLPCIVFSHDDIEFVRGEPEFRRKFFNQTMTMYDEMFFDNLRKYNQILRQRNSAIKNLKNNLIELYNTRLIHYGKIISLERDKVCNSFNSIFPEIYNNITNQTNKLKIEYRPSWQLENSEEEIMEKLYNQKETDLHLGTTTSGPHRDRFLITDSSGLFVNSASTGQMRLASILMRVSQAAFFREKTQLNPIMLVDDVLLELDSEKRKKCLTAFGKYSQAFFTFLPDENYFSENESSNFIYYDVKDGEILRK